MIDDPYVTNDEPYILMVCLISHKNTTVNFQEFSSKAACHTAKEVLKAALKQNVSQHSLTSWSIACLPK